MIPRAWMGFESIAHEAEGQIGYWLRGREGERNNCCCKFQLVGQKYWDKTTLANKTRFSRHCFGFQSWRFSLLVGELLVKSSSLCLFTFMCTVVQEQAQSTRSVKLTCHRHFNFLNFEQLSVSMVWNCVIPENIHTPLPPPPTDGQWKFLGDGGAKG